jgi:hypothetical protein
MGKTFDNPRWGIAFPCEPGWTIRRADGIRRTQQGIGRRT